MVNWIEAYDGYGNGVWLNESQIVHVLRKVEAGKMVCVARVISGENYTLKEDVFKGSIHFVESNEEIARMQEQSQKAIEEVMNHPSRLEVISKNVWTSVKDDLPEEGKQVEVCTYEGQVFVSQVLCGKFPTQIGWWKELPELPEEVKKRKAEMLESK